MRDRSKLVTEYENQVKQLELCQALAPFGQDIVSIPVPTICWYSTRLSFNVDAIFC